MSTKRFSGAAIREFLRETKGAVAIMFSLAAMVLFMFAGAAVDFSQALSVRSKLGNALDAAALAVGSSGNLTQEDAENLANDVFYANFPGDEIGSPGALSVTLDGQVVNLTATASVDTAFLGIIGKDLITVNKTNQVTREGKNLEIVMVLDNTGSMSGDKIYDLKVASKLLVDIVFGENETSDTAKIGLVPFATSVNIGKDRALTEGWIDVNGGSSVNQFNFQSDTNVHQLWQDLETKSGIEWRGCVVARNSSSPYNYDVKDTKPVTTDPETLWVPWLWPDEPDRGSSEKDENGNSIWDNYYNNYMDDGINNASRDARQRNDEKYADISVSSGSRGPNYFCPRREILPMTNQKAILKESLDNMLAEYNTNIATGLAWGWRAISKKEPFSEGAAYSDEDYIKSIILLTDGSNTVGSSSTHNESPFTAYNYLADGRLGTTTNSSYAVSQLNNKTTQLCNKIKNKGILIYTITFQVPNDSIKSLMKGCATDDGKYYDSPSGDELNNIFGAIAKELSNLRLSK